MSGKSTTSFELIVVGASHGGFEALKKVLRPLPADFPVPILVVRHQSPQTDDYLIDAMNRACQLKVTFAEAGERPQPGVVYIAPPDRHLLVDHNGRLKVTDDAPVNFSRPAIDPLFLSAAKRYGASVLAVVLTGANDDGAIGAAAIHNNGGRVMVQDPVSAESPTMPLATITTVPLDGNDIVWLDQIGPQLWDLTR